MDTYTLSQWMLFFYIYCFLGWVWECTYVSVAERRLVNRGFLKGPFLPIYGSGAICILIVTIPVRGSVPEMFLVGLVSATVLEYVTGYVMERLFRVRYWDYTGKLLNVNGYICLSSTVCWGVMTIVMVKGIHVQVEKLVHMIGDYYTDAAVLVVTPLIALDFVTSFSAALHLRDILIQKERVMEEFRKMRRKLDEVELSLRGSGTRAKEQVLQEMREMAASAGAAKERLSAAYTGSIESVRGLLKRNPTAASGSYRESLADIKLMTTKKAEDIAAEADARFENAMNGLRERFAGMSEKLGDMKDSAAEKLGGMKDSATERLGGMKDSAAEKLGGMKDSATEKLGDMKDSAAEKLGGMKDSAAEKLGGMKESVTEKLGVRREAGQELLENDKEAGNGVAE